MAFSWNDRMRRCCLLAAVVWCGLSGCGGNDIVLAPVRGRVTLEGNPVANVWVRFLPERGRGSQGRTDGDGVYVLQYTADRPGAILGEHLVQVGTHETQDAQGNPIERPELIPARYNTDSTLQASISEGENVVDLELILEPGETITPRIPVAKKSARADQGRSPK